MVQTVTHCRSGSSLLAPRLTVWQPCARQQRGATERDLICSSSGNVTILTKSSRELRLLHCSHHRKQTGANIYCRLYSVRKFKADGRLWSDAEITSTGLYRSCAALACLSGTFDLISFEAVNFEIIVEKVWFGLERRLGQTDKINGFWFTLVEFVWLSLVWFAYSTDKQTNTIFTKSNLHNNKLKSNCFK